MSSGSASDIVLAWFPLFNFIPLVSTHAWAVLETGLSNQIKQDCHMGIEGQREKRDLSSIAAGEDT